MYKNTKRPYESVKSVQERANYPLNHSTALGAFLCCLVAAFWIFVLVCVVLFVGPDLHDKLVNSFDCAAIHGSK